MYGGSRRASWNQEANGLLAKHLSTLSRLYATLPCVISITTLPPKGPFNNYVTLQGEGGGVPGVTARGRGRGSVTYA